MTPLALFLLFLLIIATIVIWRQNIRLSHLQDRYEAAITEAIETAEGRLRAVAQEESEAGADER